MMVLIVGGRYGSLATQQIEKYEKEYISITRKEYETAREKGIYVMVFVEHDVFAEYKTYIANKAKLPKDFKFAFVDDVRVFEFISTLEQRAIKIFSKVDDIEHYISHQIAGMLLTYLKQLQDKKTQEEIKTTVEQLNIVSSSMQKMLNLIGGKVLEDTQKEEYDNLILQQRKDLINFFFTIFKQDFYIKKVDDKKKSSTAIVKKIYSIVLETIFNIDEVLAISKENHPIKRRIKYRNLEQKCIQNILNEDLGYDFNIEKWDYQPAFIQVVDIIKEDINLLDYFKEKLSKTIEMAIFLSGFTFSFNSKDESNSDE
jgi:hypothetical protein